jgi:hypothetical protein
MRFSEFDPDATPVDGTQSVRPRLTRPGFALRPDERSIRRLGGAAAGPVSEAGPSRALSYVLGTLFVVLFASLVAELAAPSIFEGLRDMAPVPRTVIHRTAARISHHGTRPSLPAGSGPVLSGLSPASATPGSTVVVTGSGFFSADHQIVARVAGQPAPTTCPSRERCLVVLPSAPKGATATTVQIVTENGASNTLTIRYG